MSAVIGWSSWGSADSNIVAVMPAKNEISMRLNSASVWSYCGCFMVFLPRLSSGLPSVDCLSVWSIDRRGIFAPLTAIKAVGELRLFGYPSRYSIT